MEHASTEPVIAIVGPTACGKTRLAVHVALALDGEIISADSRQVYRRMSLGTGKDLDDYTVGERSVPYHLIDIREPGYRYNIYEYQSDFHRVLEDLRSRQVVPVVCGGSGLYVESVLKGYEMHEVPENAALRESLSTKTLDELEDILKTYKTLHNKTDTDTRQRAIREIEIRDYYRHHASQLTAYPPVPAVVFGVRVDREVRRERITRRLHARLESGMMDEVKALLDEGVPAADLIYYGLEYKYLTLYLTGELPYDEMVRQLEIAIHQFAKRQMTWFRGMERRGTPIHWMDGAASLEDMVAEVVQEYARHLGNAR